MKLKTAVVLGCTSMLSVMFALGANDITAPALDNLDQPKNKTVVGALALAEICGLALVGGAAQSFLKTGRVEYN
jgi:hypothetical protein